jgi:hypothetical protein
MKEVVISMGGAFNPVHSQHVAIMIEAKKFLESYGGGTVYKVVGGCLGAAPDGYVQRKMNKVPSSFKNKKNKNNTKQKKKDESECLVN